MLDLSRARDRMVDIQVARRGVLMLLSSTPCALMIEAAEVRLGSCRPRIQVTPPDVDGGLQSGNPALRMPSNTCSASAGFLYRRVTPDTWKSGFSCSISAATACASSSRPSWA
jgi:hypothetical protein